MGNELLQEQLHGLLSKVGQSDQEAFAEFYDITVNKIYGLVYKIIGNHDDSEEVVSDVYTQLWQQAGNYHQDKGSVIGWCMMIARSRALDLYRKRKNFYANVSALAAEESVDTEVDLGPEEFIEFFQEGGRVRNALKELSGEQRQVLTLAFFRGLTHSEIAEATSMPLGSVKSNIRRALQAIQTSMLH